MAEQREARLRLFRSVNRYPYGKFPAVAINDDRIVIELHQPFIASTTIYYQLGRLNDNRVRNWTEPEFLDYGRFPKVAINNENRVVEVHEGAYTRRVFYRIGMIEARDGLLECTWEGKSTKLTGGMYPSVAVHGNRVVITYDSSYGTYRTYYRIGTINANGRRIVWGATVDDDDELFIGESVSETSVAMNAEYVVAVGRNKLVNFMCIIAQIRNVAAVGADPDFKLSPPGERREISCDYWGYSPKICLTADRHVVLVWQTVAMRCLKYSVVVAENPEQRAITFNDSKHYFDDYGYNPSISISPNGQYIIEEHETNFAIKHLRCTLHCHTGSLERNILPAAAAGNAEAENEGQELQPQAQQLGGQPAQLQVDENQV